MSKGIDDQIVIDFPVPSSIRQIISELEKYDKEEDVYFYFDRSEGLEKATKDYVDERVLTEEQRELLIQKYSQGVQGQRSSMRLSRYSNRSKVIFMEFLAMKFSKRY